MKKAIFWGKTLITAVILFWILNLFIESKESDSWPDIQGQVISSSLIIHHLPFFLDFSADPMRVYGADVQYQYTIGDKTYTSHRIAIYDNINQNVTSALKVMNKYRKQHIVTVFYNPANPQRAVLEAGNVGDISIPLLVVVFCVFLWLFTFPGPSIGFTAPDVNDFLRSGDYYQRQGKYDQALVEYNKIIKYSPNLAIGYTRRGGLYLQQSNWNEAIKDFNQAILLNPEDGKNFYDRANAFLGKRQYEEAWEQVKIAIKKGFKVSPEFLGKITKGL